ncbi:MAG: hypothetical protein Tsb0019_06550 [Roseibium sp.]
MATLVLTAVGTAFAGPLGAFAGALVGSRIDAALFGPVARSEGPRLDDISVQASTYGQPVPRLYGTVRVAGNLIWSSGLIETETTKVQGGKGGGTRTKTTTFTYHVDCAIALGKGPISAVRRIWADGKLFRDEAGVSKQASDIRVYPGSKTQLPDPVIQAALGPADTPAFRGTAYVVFEHLELGDFGNRIPNFSFELVAGETATVATVIEDLLGDVAIPFLDAARTERIDLAGYAIARPVTLRAALDPLRAAHFFDMAEIEGTLEVFPVDGTPAAKVPGGHLAAHPFGSDRPQTFEARRTADLELPRQVTVQHLDPERDFQANSQRARRSTLNSTADVTVDLPLVLGASEAKAIAERMLSVAWARRDAVTLQLPMLYLHVEPGMKLVVGLEEGRERLLRVTRKELRLPGTVLLECETDGASVLVKTALAAPSTVPVQKVLLPGVTVAHLMDIPMLRDADDDAGFYVAGNGASAGWAGAVLFRSRDGGVNHEPFLDIPSGAVIGTALDVLAPGPADYWDRDAGVTVALLDSGDTLASVMEADALGGANAALVGEEILQFTTATLTAPGTYRLSGLLRGRKGTEGAIATHQTGERFVLLTGGGVLRPVVETSEIGALRHYKAASVGTLLSDAEPIAFADTGRSLRPYAPAHLEGHRQGDDLVLSWIRRTRLDAPWLDGVDAPLGEEAESYEIDILDDAGAVLRTLASTVPTVTYLTADQTADFGAPQPAIKVRVFQLSARVGRGLPQEGVL